MSSVIFESERLLCRHWVPEDLEPLYAVYSDADAMRWVGDGTPISRAGCEQWLQVTSDNYERRGYGMFALVERASGQVIGFAGLVHPGNQEEAEIKYAFLRPHWGQGLASEAVPLLLRYGNEQHGLERIIATVAPEHRASQRVLEKAGLELAQRRQNEDGSITFVYEWLAPGSDSTPERFTPLQAGLKNQGSRKGTSSMHADTIRYNESQAPGDREICELLAREIDRCLPEAENKVWHAHPVWFLDGNPVVGYSKLKDSVRLLFWSGRSFEEDGLQDEGSFKAAEARYTAVDQVDSTDLRRWLAKARDIQWDYKNIVKRKGQLERLK